MQERSPLLLLILDGWGVLDKTEHNAIALAKTPQWDAWLKHYPHTTLEASGESVGLPKGQIGNSEVGHMHIGAGRLILQELSQINHDIDHGEFAKKAAFKDICQLSLEDKSCLHVMGLLSEGGVHSHQNHLFAFLQLAKKLGGPRIALHLFLDGRDVAPKSALASIQALNQILSSCPFARIASICGRYYAMDRDQRWDRLKACYDLITLGDKPKFDSAEQAIEHAYAAGITDEFIPPCVIGDQAQVIQDQDNVFFFNFRADRAIQLTKALFCPNWTEMPRQVFPKIKKFLSMTQYAEDIHCSTVYPARVIPHSLAEVLAQAKLKQLRLAETEKFAHVTYFFNGGREQAFELEERRLIPSAKVKTYDLMPQMRAQEITDVIVDALEHKRYDVIIANFANPDMIGHCGELATTITAIEFLDQCFQRIHQALEQSAGCAIITADHGNAEMMYNETSGQKHTAHTLSPVPFVFIGKDFQLNNKHASLIDIAPSILYILNLKKPKEMTGHSLLERITK